MINPYPSGFLICPKCKKKFKPLLIRKTKKPTDNDVTFSIFDTDLKTLIDVWGSGKQLVGPGSFNKKTGKVYEIIKDIPIVFIPYGELRAILMPFDKRPKKVIKEKTQIFLIFINMSMNHFIKKTILINYVFH